jgi:hypothetical protein
MRKGLIRFVVPAVLLSLSVGLGACCEEEESVAPAEVKKAADSKAEKTDKVQPEKKAAETKTGDTAEPVKEAPKKEEPKKDRFARDQALMKSYFEAMGTQPGQGFDYMNIAEGQDIVAVFKEDWKPEVKVKVALGAEGKILSKAEGLASLLGASKKPAEFNACKFWLGSPFAILDLSDEKKVLKLSIWCSLDPDPQAPPKSIELVLFYALDEKLEDVSKLNPIWVGFAGRTEPLTETCSRMTASTFTMENGSLKQTLKKSMVYMPVAATTDTPPDPNKMEEEREKCEDGKEAEDKVLTHKIN